MKNRLKNTIKWMFVSAVALCAAGCNDWTDTESLKIDQNDINKQNPELYAKYLADLRNYKKNDHKILFGWYDNVEVPVSQANNLMSLPDSVDIVALENPDNLPLWIVREMTDIRDQKGTRCVYTISFPAIEAAWAAQNQPEVTADDEPTPENPVLAFIAEYMDKALSICGKYPYEGIEFNYPGRSTVTMSEADKADYLARQQAFFDKAKAWKAANESKLLILKGNTQYIHDMELFPMCAYIIVPTEDLATLEALNKAFAMASIEGVPTDRFLVAVRMTSLNSSDLETGYFGKNRALSEAAYWTLVPSAKYTKAGVAVDNLQRDYYYINHVYKYTREALTIMNPAPKN